MLENRHAVAFALEHLATVTWMSEKPFSNNEAQGLYQVIEYTHHDGSKNYQEHSISTNNINICMRGSPVFIQMI